MFPSLKRKRSIKKLTEKGRNVLLFKRFHHSVSELEGEWYLVASRPFPLFTWIHITPSESCTTCISPSLLQNVLAQKACFWILVLNHSPDNHTKWTKVISPNSKAQPFHVDETTMHRFRRFAAGLELNWKHSKRAT